MLSHLDLFSGVGGFALSAKWTGWETIGFSEIDPYCCKVLAKNFPGIPNLGDIKNVNAKTVQEALGFRSDMEIVAKAIATGKLTPQPCEICGGQLRHKDGQSGVQVHHDDYNFPLTVRWLCKIHHDEWHRHNNPIRKEVMPQETSNSKVSLLTGGFP